MINDKAYINCVEVDLEFAGLYHEIRSKVALGIKLTDIERSLYLLLMATPEEIKEYLKNEKN